MSCGRARRDWCRERALLSGQVAGECGCVLTECVGLAALPHVRTSSAHVPNMAGHACFAGHQPCSTPSKGAAHLCAILQGDVLRGEDGQVSCGSRCSPPARLGALLRGQLGLVLRHGVRGPECSDGQAAIESRLSESGFAAGEVRAGPMAEADQWRTVLAADALAAPSSARRRQIVEQIWPTRQARSCELEKLGELSAPPH